MGCGGRRTRPTLRPGYESGRGKTYASQLKRPFRSAALRADVARGGASLRARVREDQGPGPGRAPDRREHADGGGPGASLLPRGRRSRRLRSRRESRTPPGGRQVRSDPRHQVLQLRGLVDPGVHVEAHDEQLAARQGRNDAGPAQAVLLAGQGARPAAAGGWRGESPRAGGSTAGQGERGRRHAGALRGRRDVAGDASESAGGRRDDARRFAERRVGAGA